MSGDLKTRAAAALEGVTDGPWSEGDTLTRFVFNMTIDPSDPRAVICEAYEESDASFIAASRDLVPELLACVMKLEAALREIAAYDDILASVQTARAALEGK